jgi:hypothetical protein
MYSGWGTWWFGLEIGIGVWKFQLSNPRNDDKAWTMLCSVCRSGSWCNRKNDRTFKIFENRPKTGCNLLQPVFHVHTRQEYHLFYLCIHSFFNPMHPRCKRESGIFFRLRFKTHQIIATTRTSLWHHPPTTTITTTTGDHEQRTNESPQWPMTANVGPQQRTMREAWR